MVNNWIRQCSRVRAHLDELLPSHLCDTLLLVQRGTQNLVDEVRGLALQSRPAALPLLVVLVFRVTILLLRLLLRECAVELLLRLRYGAEVAHRGARLDLRLRAREALRLKVLVRRLGGLLLRQRQ